MFYKCKQCGFVQERHVLKQNDYICIQCGYYEVMTSQQRILQILDDRSFQESDFDLGFQNPILFPDYDVKYKAAATKTGMKEAVITGSGTIHKTSVMIGIMDAGFMMGSMGVVVGEKITRLFERALAERKPAILFCASGGARMQEGILSLMQMAKTASAIAEFGREGGLYISVLTHPTMGGVSASFAFLGDIILAEPKALIGFAGKRVIEQTIHEKLPDEFQKAEYLLDHGLIDAIVERKQLKDKLYQLLSYHSGVDRNSSEEVYQGV